MVLVWLKGFNQDHTRLTAVELTWWLMVTQRVQVLVLRLLELLFWFTLFSQLLMLREVPETLMSLYVANLLLSLNWVEFMFLISVELMCVFWLSNILQILAPLPIGFAVFLVHLATIPITGTGINPARSLGAAIIYNKDHAWDDHVSSSLITSMVVLSVISMNRIKHIEFLKCGKPLPELLFR